MTPFLRRVMNKLPANIFRMVINWWPPFVGASIKVTKISKDYRYLEVAMRLRWFNRNYVGTHFGGSIFAMTDPFDMLILLKNLGNDYIVWDKAAKIDYLKPGRTTLHTTFSISEDELQNIRNKADAQGKYIFDKTVEVIDDNGEIIASVVKTLYVRQKDFSLPSN